MPITEHLSCRSARAVAAAAALAGLSGCSYTSTYVPPNDGRARLVWTGRQVGESLPVMDGACASHVAALSSEPWPVAAETRETWWDPERDADATSAGVSVNGGVSFGSGGHHVGGHVHGASGGGHVGVASGGSSGAGHSGGGGGGGHGGGGGGGNWGEGAVVLVVLAFVVAPIVSVIWSTDRPEETTVAGSMDRVHAYNDTIRSGESPCGSAP